MARLGGKVMLVTGAASGMGAATARLAAAEGARVIVSDLDAKGADVIAASLGAGNGVGIRLDIAQAEDWQTAIALGERLFGWVDILINNAGIYSTGGVESVELDEFDRHVAINQRGTLLGIRHVAPAMRRVGGGAIVNIASTVALRGGPGMVAYRMAKWAVRGLTRSAAHDLAGDRIRVNAVLPGPIDTGMMSADETQRAELAARTLMRRLGRPEEVAAATVFLASDAASFITGAELVVDGGALA